MKKFSNPVFISTIVLMTLAYVFALSAHAQQVVRKGNTFIEQHNGSSSKGDVVKTEFIYQDSKGQVDTVYLSSTGKAFVYRVSKNGRTYKKYLPEIGKQINPKAYESDNKTGRKGDK